MQKTIAKTPQDHIGKTNNVFSPGNSGSAGEDQTDDRSQEKPAFFKEEELKHQHNKTATNHHVVY